MESDGTMLVVENDRISIAGLCMVLQRIDLSHWSAETALRSWAITPIIVTGDRVASPCAINEAIWIGFWLDGDVESAIVSITDKLSGLHSSKRCPESFQLSVLSNDSKHPICRNPNQSMREFEVEVTVTGRSREISFERFRLCLLEPHAWAKESGRPEPSGLKGPPPLPPRLG
jgi:hypothetical protein